MTNTQPCLKYNHNKVYGFDVFDTVVTRLVGAPQSVFLLAGAEAHHRGLISLSAMDFCARRVLAETKARNLKTSSEVCIRDIYDQLQAMLNINSTTRNILLQIEAVTERKLIYAIPDAQKDIHELMTSGKQPLFISDMYLSKDFICDLLKSTNIMCGNPVCYVSSECGRTKRSGELFNYVLRVEKIKKADFVFVGNDEVSDIMIPNRIGINVMPRTCANLNRYEQLVERYAEETTGLSSLMAGASRCARLTSKCDSESDSPLIAVSSGVVGPVLTGYVLWLLKTAIEMGIERLYFVSRDGQILLAIARRLNDRLRYPVELKYLHGSRQAWHAASITHIDDNDATWILDRTDSFTIEGMLLRLHLTPNEVRTCLEKYGFPENTWRTELNKCKRRNLAILLRDECFNTHVARRAALKREIVLKYFRQEGLFDSCSKAMVDLGWNGTMHDSLSRLLCQGGGASMGAYFFGLKRKPDDERMGFRKSYMFENGVMTTSTPPVENIATVMEMFCAATHGQTIGYNDDGSSVEPNYDDRHKEAIVRWGVNTVHSVVLKYVDSFRFDEYPINPHVDLKPILRKLLQVFWLSPTRQEAQVWGAFPFGDEQVGANFAMIAKAYRKKDLPRILYRGSLSLYRGSWESGSLAISPKMLRVLSRLCAQTGFLLRRVQRLIAKY